MGLGSLIAALALLLAAAALGAAAWRGSQRRLPRNHLLGIRVRSTMRSEPAWIAAHEAAAGALGVGAGIALVGAIGVLAVGLDLIGTVLVLAATAGVLLSVVVGARAAVRAAAQES